MYEPEALQAREEACDGEPDADHAERDEQHDGDGLEERPEAQGHADQDAERENDDALDDGVRADAEHLAQEDGNAGYRGDKDLLHEPELAIPDDRDAHEHGRELQRLCYYAGKYEHLVSDICCAVDGQADAGAEDDQPEQRLDERAYKTRPFPGIPQYFPVPEGVYAR